SATAGSRASGSRRWSAASRRSPSTGASWRRSRSRPSVRGCAPSMCARRLRKSMASIDVPVALLGYGTVGAAVNRLLTESADDIERATGHRLRVVKALVRDPEKERSHRPADGVLTQDFAAIADDPSIAVVAEGMGGLDPPGPNLLALLAP